MKIKLQFQLLQTGNKKFLTLGMALLAFAAASPTRGASPSELLEKGIYTEETRGDLKAATQIYQQIVDQPGAERGLVAQAQLRLGFCELKLGNKPQAISALERLTQEFPDKDKLLALVGQQLPQLLEEMVNQIEQNYIQEVDRNALIETAIRAIIGKLDAQTGSLRPNDLEFLGANEMDQLNASLEQKIAGIGITLKLDDETHEIVVTGLLPNSPALKGGLLAGDRLVEIEGSQFTGNGTLESAVKLIRGTPGTSVSLAVKRSGLPELLPLHLPRDVVQLPSVKGLHYKADYTSEFMLDESSKIGYVRLTEVGKRSAQEMQAAIIDLQARALKGLILDLRNNPGGLLDQGVAIADLFVRKGTIVTVKGRGGVQGYEAAEEGTVPDFPMVLLVNRKTASSAEIIAACLQDHQRAVVVGERTFGQGIVRTILPLKDGIGSLKLPVASYFRPSGKTMNRYPGAAESEDWGVKPNPGYEVVLGDDEFKEYEKDRSGRDVMSNPQTAPSEFRDRQLEKAKENLWQRLQKE
jgi:carboxyl-terminal processing protease